MGGQLQLTIALILIGLFTFAIINFAVNFADDNNSPVNLADDPELSSLNTQSQSKISTFSDEAESSYSSIIDTPIAPGSDVPRSAGVFAITPLNAISVVKNILSIGYLKIFGTGAGFGIFLGALIAIISFAIGLYIWKTIRGQPD